MDTSKLSLHLTEQVNEQTKISKTLEDLNKIINQLELILIEPPHRTKAEFKFFSSACGHSLKYVSQNSNLNNFKRPEIIQSIFFEDNELH